MQFLYLGAIYIAAFLAFVLLTKKGKTTADYILACWLCISGYTLFSFYLVYTSNHLLFPTLVAMGIAMPLAQGPALFLYTKYQTTAISFQKRDLLHLLPLLAGVLLFSNFYFLPFEEKVLIFKNGGSAFETVTTIKLAGIYISGLVYIPLSLYKILRFKKNLKNEFSNTDRINFNWLLFQTIGLSIVWIVILFIQDDLFIFGSASVYLLWLGYFGIKQVNVFSQFNDRSGNHIQNTELLQQQLQSIKENQKIIPNIIADEITLTDNITEEIKNKKPALSDNEVKVIHEKLLLVLNEQKTYLNPELTLTELARLVNVHPNILSYIINYAEQKTFYDLINEKRIIEFLKRVVLPDNRSFTLLSIAYDCGFNSKASFNRNFKKYTGLTPSEYLQQNNVVSSVI